MRNDSAEVLLRWLTGFKTPTSYLFLRLFFVFVFAGGYREQF